MLNDGGKYFGPYPQLTYIKKLISWINKIFKIRSCKINFNEQNLPKAEKVKSCLYYHTQLCYGPCMGHISSAQYKENVKNVEFFFNGKFKQLKNIWKKQMLLFSKNQEYEKAKEIRDRLFAVESLSQRVSIQEINIEDINDYLQKTDALQELKTVLKLKKLPAVIECFDISNTSGTNPVASMVQFVNAKPNKSGYRKFKIKSVEGINDFAMINEAVYRRYSGIIRRNEKFPDLVVIDGGKSQLAFANKALDDIGIYLPLISLAKKQEEIFIVGKANSIILPRNNTALQLLQHISDEAHRFAITFHKSIKEKKFLEKN